MAWESAGTVTVTNGSKVVTGAGTAFVEKALPSDAFIGPDGLTYEIDYRVSQTELRLKNNYRGAGAAGQSYAIQPTQGYSIDLATRTDALLTGIASIKDTVGLGKFPDGTVAAPGFRFLADEDNGIYRPGTNMLGIVTAGVERIRVLADGKVGVGIAAPTEPLHVFGNIKAAGTVTSGIVGSGGSSRYLNDAGVANWLTGLGGAAGTTSYLIYDLVANATRVAIDSAGKVGIGTVAPTAPLHVAGANQALGGNALVSGVLHLTTTDALAANKGASITLGGTGNTGQLYTFAGIHGKKFAAGAGLTEGYLAFEVCNALGVQTERMRIVYDGRTGFGTSTPPTRFVFSDGGAEGVEICMPGDISLPAGATAFQCYNRAAGTFTDHSYYAKSHTFSKDGGALAVKIGADGGLYAGVAVNTGYTTAGGHRFVVQSAAQGEAMVSFDNNSSGYYSLVVMATLDGSYNTAKAAIFVGRNNVTGRSGNFGGTVNVAGADYAEYIRRAPGCGDIAAGDICGLDAHGQLTRKWADAVAGFVLKSEQPGVVGGDTWGSEDAKTPEGKKIGKEPVAPAEVPVLEIAEPDKVAPFKEKAPATFSEPEPAAFDEPEPDTPIAPPAFDEAPPHDASDEDIALWAERDSAARLERYHFLAAMKPVEAWQERRAAAATARAEWEKRRARHDDETAAWEARRDQHAAAVAARDAAVEERAAALAENADQRAAWEADQAKFVTDYAAWSARHEAARGEVDRIAFCGLCPVNLPADADPVAGSYVVAAASGSGIKGIVVPAADMTMELYMRRIGRITAIRDGRTWVDVQHG